MTGLQTRRQRRAALLSNLDRHLLVLLAPHRGVFSSVPILHLFASAFVFSFPSLAPPS